MARHPLVKKKSRLFVLAPGPKIGGLALTRNLPDECITDEARHDGHRVLGEAKRQVLLVPASVAGDHGAGSRTFSDTARL
jgi:hypothetical protein